MNRIRVHLVAVALLAVVVMSACASGHTANTTATAGNERPGPSLLTIGGSATEGDGIADRLHHAWPYLVFGDALSRNASLVNAALDDASAMRALQNQVPLAREMHPDVVAVWLGLDEWRAHTPVTSYAQSLRAVVTALQATHPRQVLVADLPATFGTSVHAYDDAIRQVVATTGATLVELESAPVTLRPDADLGNEPDTAGHRAIADAFIARLAPSLRASS